MSYKKLVDEIKSCPMNLSADQADYFIDRFLAATKESADRVEQCELLLDMALSYGENYVEMEPSRKKNVLIWIFENWDANSYKYIDAALSVLATTGYKDVCGALVDKENQTSNQKIKELLREFIYSQKSDD